MSKAHIHFNAWCTKSIQFNYFRVLFEVNDARHKIRLDLFVISIWQTFTKPASSVFCFRWKSLWFCVLGLCVCLCQGVHKQTTAQSQHGDVQWNSLQKFQLAIKQAAFCSLLDWPSKKSSVVPWRWCLISEYEYCCNCRPTAVQQTIHTLQQTKQLQLFYSMSKPNITSQNLFFNWLMCLL